MKKIFLYSIILIFISLTTGIFLPLSEFSQNNLEINFDFFQHPIVGLHTPDPVFANKNNGQIYDSKKFTSSAVANFHNEIAENKINKIKTASILNFGDLMLDRSVKKQIDKNGVDYIFTKLANQDNLLTADSDAIAANLEGPFADKRRATSKSIAFRFDPKLIATLTKYHFNLFNLANNHSQDMSLDGFKESQKNLTAAGISFYGQQYKANDQNLLVKQIGDFKFGFIGLDDTINKIKISQVKSLVDKAKSQGAEIILANVHWGDEYKLISNQRQRQLAHALIDSGVDVIIGHHPHIVEEMEIYNNHPIFYSLGNFVFDQYFSVPTQQELSVGLIFTELNNQKNISAYVFPMQSIKSQISFLPTEAMQKYFDTWLKTSRLGGYKFENYYLKINIH